MPASPSLKLELATVKDVSALTDIWFAAFTDPEFQRLWPDTPGVRQWWNEVNYNAIVKVPSRRCVKVVDTSSVDGQGRPRIAAYAIWDLAMPNEQRQRYPPWHADMPGQILDEFIGRENNERIRILGSEKNYYLDTVVAHPDYQRKGAASMLVKWGCDLADADGVAAYVDASKDGAPLYQKFGFVDESEPNATSVALMVRRRK